MTKTSRAMVFHEAERPLELRTFGLPSLTEGQILVRISCCTLCGSDVHTFEGRRSAPLPTILGHEIIGHVAELPAGPKVCDFEGTPLEVGDRITWSVAASCGDCFFCNNGLPQKCLRLFKYGHERISEQHPFSGGLAEHCHLAAGTTVVRLPSALSDAVACPANCATATVAAAMRYAGGCKDRVVLIQGAGMLGLTAAAMAQVAGAREVIVCDTVSERLPRAASFGATRTACVKQGEDELDAIVAAVSANRGVDVAIDVSGAPAAIESGIGLLRTGGRYVWVGAVFPARPLAIAAETVVRKILSIQGIHNYGPGDLSTAVRFLHDNHGQFPFEELVAKQFALEDANAAFAHAAGSGALRVAVTM
jgi:putative phosphonate catabolism associated alcohol dehydrogenase